MGRTALCSVKKWPSNTLAMERGRECARRASMARNVTPFAKRKTMNLATSTAVKQARNCACLDTKTPLQTALSVSAQS